jgi:hypothetical protein
MHTPITVTAATMRALADDAPLTVFVPASTVAVGCYVVDGEGTAFRVSEVRRERGLLSFGLEKNGRLIVAPTHTGRLRPTTKVRILTPEGEARETLRA